MIQCFPPVYFHDGASNVPTASHDDLGKEQPLRFGSRVEVRSSYSVFCTPSVLVAVAVGHDLSSPEAWLCATSTFSIPPGTPSEKMLHVGSKMVYTSKIHSVIRTVQKEIARTHKLPVSQVKKATQRCSSRSRPRRVENMRRALRTQNRECETDC